MTANRRIRSASRLLLSVSFVALLWAPMLDAAFSLDPSPEREERRLLHERPRLAPDPDSLAEFPSRFDAFYGDRMGFRSSLIRWNNYIEVLWLETVPDVGEASGLPAGAAEVARKRSRGRKVVMGTDGWFFYAGEGALEDFRGVRPLEAGDLKDWLLALEARRNWLRDQGARYVLLIAPNKESIYPEFMPADVRRVSRVSRLDRILEHLRQDSDLIVVDPRPDLRAARAYERVYDRTDSHWNDLGAHVAYTKLMEAIGNLFPGVEAHDRSWFRVRRETGRGGGLASLLGIAESLREERIILQRKLLPTARRSLLNVLRGVGADSTPYAMTGASSPISRAVLFSDSFGPYLVPFLAEHFQRLVFYEGTGFLTEVVVRERPELVIEVMAERTFVRRAPSVLDLARRRTR